MPPATLGRRLALAMRQGRIFCVKFGQDMRARPLQLKTSAVARDVFFIRRELTIRRSGRSTRMQQRDASLRGRSRGKRRIEAAPRPLVPCGWLSRCRESNSATQRPSSLERYRWISFPRGRRPYWKTKPNQKDGCVTRIIQQWKHGPPAAITSASGGCESRMKIAALWRNGREASCREVCATLDMP